MPGGVAVGSRGEGGSEGEGSEGGGERGATTEVIGQLNGPLWWYERVMLPANADGSGVLDRPYFISAVDRGTLCIVDTMHHQVRLLDLQGGTIRVYGTHGSAPGEFKVPSGVLCLHDGITEAESNMVVCEMGNCRLQKISIRSGRAFATGGHRGAAGSDGGEALRSPQGVAARRGRVYVCDTSNNRIAIFGDESASSSSFRFVFEFGEPGSAFGQFKGPTDIAINSMGML
jgi:sugar lactone lactonase YvrE